MSEGKFGFTSDVPNEEQDLALSFAPTPINRADINIAAVDRAAQDAGFTSRESGPHRRRRRIPPAEPTRYIAIRAPETLYMRFLHYADKHQLTYSDAISRLLDEVEKKES